jgi:dicarboxylate transporter 10
MTLLIFFAVCFYQTSSVFSVTQKLLQEQGARGLFKGWTPAFVRLAPNTVIMFVILEVRVRSKKMDFLTSSYDFGLQQLKKAWSTRFA